MASLEGSNSQHLQHESYIFNLGDVAAQLATEWRDAHDWPRASDQLILLMAGGGAPNTRPFLRSIYRLCKNIGVGIKNIYSRPTQQTAEKAEESAARWKSHGNFRAALAVAEWLVELSTRGDARLGLTKQCQIQPAYAYNTIIAMCQRASATDEALACYSRMCHHCLPLDVFTMTALIDVVGRAHNGSCAHWLFSRMSSGHSLSPNVVTLVTAARTAIVNNYDPLFNEVFSAPCISTMQTPSIVLLSAFECSVSMERLDLATRLLELLHALQITPDESRSLQIFQSLSLQDSTKEAVTKWCIEGLLPPSVAIMLESAELDDGTCEGSSGAQQSLSFHHHQSLGRNSTPAMRREVVEHDISQLDDRLLQQKSASETLSFDHITSAEFETLIHQCRKRKWPQEVTLVLEAMVRIDEREGGSGSLKPGNSTLLCALDAFLDTGDIRGGWDLLNSAPEKWGVFDRATPDPACSLDASAQHLSQLWLPGTAQVEGTNNDDGGELGSSDDSGSASAHLAFCRAAVRHGELGLGLVALKHFLDQVEQDATGGALQRMLLNSNSDSNKVLFGMFRALGKDPVEASSVLSRIHDISVSTSFSSPIPWLSLISLWVESSGVLRSPLSVGEFIVESSPFHRDILHPHLFSLCPLDPGATTSLLIAAASHGMMIKGEKNVGGPSGAESAVSFMFRFTRSTLKNHSGIVEITAAEQHICSETAVPLMARLPFFVSILHEAFLVCPSAAFKPVMTRKIKRSVGAPSCAEEQPINDSESLPFNSFSSSGLLRFVASRLPFLQRVFALLTSQPVEGASGESAPTFEQWEAYFGGVGAPPTLFATSACTDDAFLKLTCQEFPRSLSSNPAASIELSALIRLQWLHVRCLSVANKADRDQFMLSLVSVFKENDPQALLLNSLSHLGNPALSLPGKIQGRLATFLADAFQIATEPSNEFVVKVAESLHNSTLNILQRPAQCESDSPLGISLDLLRALHKAFFASFLAPTTAQPLDLDTPPRVNSGERSDQQVNYVGGLLLECLLSMVENEDAKPLKLAQFIRTHEVHRFARQPESILHALLGLGRQSTSLGASDVKDWCPAPESLEPVLALLSLPSGATVDSDTLRLRHEFIKLLVKTSNPHLAAKFVCRFELAKDFPELLHSSLSISPAANEGPEGKQGSSGGGAPSSLNQLDYLLLEDSCEVRIVNDLTSVRHARAVLLGEGKAGSREAQDTSVVGLDCEWRPFKRGMAKSPVALLQVANKSNAFLFDLLQLESGSSLQSTPKRETIPPLSAADDAREEAADPRFEYRHLIEELFLDPGITKIGFGFAGDLHRLQESYDWKTLPSTIVNLRDFHSTPPIVGHIQSTTLPVQSGGLSGLVERVLGKFLDKRMQTSDWGARPLTDDQIHYAALDAHCLVQIHGACLL